ncbi:dynamin GTPase [Pseudohyphozyma bogoriensis]|nr:dynamin GTPase [Pseudohyphozyma bogoriensis]
MDGDLISVVNKLQETFSAIGGETVDLPQIVTVGSQSSGKSSVLETIVGKDFLPRGQGIVTRRPLVLQLVHIPSPTPPSNSANPGFTTPDATTVPEEFGEFLHLDKRFYDFADIRKEIENETLRVAGGNKGISRLPIHLKIHSPNVLNLTLVDLPGLTKIPVGDQPTDIERQIRNLVLDYISKPNCVILAISGANVDLANSDSLKLARSVDPQGRRTIGVLTKLDLMDAGTNALDILTGRVYPLKLGFIGVVNRSQQDINANKPMDQQLETETEFFRNHAGYRNIAHRCGTKFLAKTLNQVLMNHIRDKLPDMKARLNTLMGQTQQELNAFGDSAFQGEQHRGTLILKLMTQFVRDFVASIDGTSLEISTKELCGGARIYYIFNDVFGHALESINPTHNLTVQDIRTAIRNSTGPRPSLFVPEVAFDLLVKPQIKLLEPPSLRCVELVYEELMKICHNCTSTELQRYPRLHAQLIEVVSELLRERLGPTSEYVQSLISIQAAYINTNHPDFVAGSAAAAQEAAREAHAKKQALLEPKKEASEDGEKETSGPDDDDETGYVVPNGRPSTSKLLPDPKHRSASSTIHDRQSALSALKPNATPRSITPTNHLAPPSGGGGIPPFASPYGVSPSSASAKDSFLSYFFGGSEMPSLQAGRANERGALPDISRRERGDNPMSGRKGLEGNAAAFDMKSLDKHLEATPSNPDDPHESSMTSREEMETSLIRALISSYFSIVRQTIQDLVPKAIMHLLVNFSRESVQNRLVASLYKENLFESMLQEDESLTAERTRVKSLLAAYKEAFNVLCSTITALAARTTSNPVVVGTAAPRTVGEALNVFQPSTVPQFGRNRVELCTSLTQAAIAGADKHGTFRTPSRENVVTLLVLENLVESLEEEGHVVGQFGTRPFVNGYMGHFHELLTVDGGVDVVIAWTVLGRDCISSATTGRNQMVTEDDLAHMREDEFAETRVSYPAPFIGKSEVLSASPAMQPIGAFNVCFGAFFGHIVDSTRFAAQSFATYRARKAPLSEILFDTYLSHADLALNGAYQVISIGNSAAVIQFPYIRRHIRALQVVACYHGFLAYRIVQERLDRQSPPSDTAEDSYWMALARMRDTARRIAFRAVRQLVEVLRETNAQGETVGSIQFLDWRIQSIVFGDIRKWASILVDMPTVEQGGPATFSFDVKIAEMETILRALYSLQFFQARLRYAEAATWLDEQLERVKLQRNTQAQFNALPSSGVTLDLGSLESGSWQPDGLNALFDFEAAAAGVVSATLGAMAW